MFNTFVERPATDGRMLFWLAALYKVPGMLYYITDDWSGLCNFRSVITTMLSRFACCPSR